MQISMIMTIGPAIIFALCGQDIFLYVSNKIFLISSTDENTIFGVNVSSVVKVTME